LTTDSKEARIAFLTILAFLHLELDVLLDEVLEGRVNDLFVAIHERLVWDGLYY